MKDKSPVSKKAKIIASRLDGNTITTIASDLDVSRQYVYSIIHYFSVDPSEDMSECDAPKDQIDRLTKGKIFRICCDKMEGLSDAEIIGKYKLTTSQLHKIYHLILNRRSYYPNKVLESLYPEIEQWRKKNDMSVKQLAVFCDYPLSKMNLVLCGQKDMPRELARKLKEKTGLRVEGIAFE